MSVIGTKPYMTQQTWNYVEKSDKHLVWYFVKLVMTRLAQIKAAAVNLKQNLIF